MPAHSNSIRLLLLHALRTCRLLCSILVLVRGRFLLRLLFLCSSRAFAACAGSLLGLLRFLPLCQPPLILGHPLLECLPPLLLFFCRLARPHHVPDQADRSE